MINFFFLSILPPAIPETGVSLWREERKKRKGKKRGRRTVVGGGDLDSSHIGGLVG
jgi:hypothetical protein